MLEEEFEELRNYIDNWLRKVSLKMKWLETEDIIEITPEGREFIRERRRRV